MGAVLSYTCLLKQMLSSVSSLLKCGFVMEVSTPSIEAPTHQLNSYHFPQQECGWPPHVTTVSALLGLPSGHGSIKMKKKCGLLF